MQQMSIGRASPRNALRAGLALCAVLALYALAVILLVSP
jgi:hypothetical protein